MYSFTIFYMYGTVLYWTTEVQYCTRTPKEIASN